jgi:ADP-ribose pyrophosphatase YjhB (NUDIX family)
LDAAWAAAEIEPGAVNEGLSEAARRSVRESVRFSSDCYRFICVATLYDEQRGGRGVRTRAYEAVVLYDEEGRPQIRYWNETQTPQPAQTGDV